MYKKLIITCLKSGCIFWSILFLTGCGKNPSIDRFEPVNRAIFQFNKTADRILIKPAASTYETVTPKLLRQMVGNFFQNLSEIPTIGNDLLQGEFLYASTDLGRFLINSSWGAGGLLDVAAERGVEKRKQDFGMTLVKWGYENSSYIVLPLFGPSTIRDGIGLAGTYYMSVPAYINSVSLRNRMFALNFIDARASLLKADPVINDAVDEYVFMREAYFQNRRYQIKGGKEADVGIMLLEEPPL